MWKRTAEVIPEFSAILKSGFRLLIFNPNIFDKNICYRRICLYQTNQTYAKSDNKKSKVTVQKWLR